MRLVRSIAGALLLVMGSAAGGALRAQSAAADRASRAVWTWERPSVAMVLSPAVADEALAFARRKHLTALYLYADAFEGRHLLRDEPQRYRDLIRAAHASGIRVYALLGSWYLHTERYVLPAFRPAAVAMVQTVLDYNAAAVESERFDGMNYDIEPHLLDAWDASTRESLLIGFLDMTAAMMEAKRRSGQSLPIGPAIPFWWDGIVVEWRGVRKAASEHIIDVTDYVTLMDYRNRADGSDSILSHAMAELGYAERVGKRVEIGLEFNPTQPAKLSFHRLTEAAFEREAATVEAGIGMRPGFGGFVFHHYEGYRRFVGEPVPAVGLLP